VGLRSRLEDPFRIAVVGADGAEVRDLCCRSFIELITLVTCKQDVLTFDLGGGEGAKKARKKRLSEG
jgi:hypothetical protein